MTIMQKDTLQELTDNLTPLIEQSYVKVESLEKEIKDVINNFLNENLNENPQEVYNAIKKFPTIFFFLKFDPTLQKDKEEFDYFFEALLNMQSTNTFSENSIYARFIFLNYYPNTFEQMTEMFTKDTFKLFKGKMNLYNSYLMNKIHPIIEELYTDKKELLVDLFHNSESNKKTQSHRVVCNQLVENNASFIDEDVFNLFKDEIMSKSIYFKSYDKEKYSDELTLEYFKDFMTDEEILTFLEYKGKETNLYNLRMIINKSEDLISADKLTELLDVYIEQDFSNKFGGNLFGSFSDRIKNMIAYKVIKLNPWLYQKMTKEMQIEMFENGTVNFEEHKGLYKAHPYPEKVSLSVWKELLLNADIALNGVPSIIFDSNKGFKEDDWFVLLTEAKRNNFFSYIINNNKEILTESLIQRIIKLENHEILRKGFFVSYIKEKEKQEKNNKILNEAIEVAKTGDEKETAAAISKMIHEKIVKKEDIEKVLVAFKNK